MLVFTVNDTPELKELQSLITPNYASCWNEIGIGLGLPYATLQIIEEDYNKTEQQCNNMLAKWLQKDVTATWQKLLQVIDSPAITTMLSLTFESRHNESKYIVLSHIRYRSEVTSQVHPCVMHDTCSCITCVPHPPCILPPKGTCVCVFRHTHTHILHAFI